MVWIDLVNLFDVTSNTCDFNTYSMIYIIIVYKLDI